MSEHAPDYTYFIVDKQVYTCVVWSLCQSLLYFQGVILSDEPFCFTVSEHCVLIRFFVVRHQTWYSKRNVYTM